MSSLNVGEIYALKYVGSKRRMAGKLSLLIPNNCTTYAEPFCGSAALALNSRSFELKILNDANPHIANFWRVMASDRAVDVLEKLKNSTCSRTLFEEAKTRRECYGSKQTDLVQWAVDTYILNWQSFNAKGECWNFVEPTAYYKHISSPIGLPLVIQRLAEQKIRVCNVNAVELFGAFNLLDNERTFIFLDPPYMEGLRSEGQLYRVDMPDIRDHIILLKTVRDARAKIVLSGYWSGRDDGSDLYDYYLLSHGWHRHLLGGYVKDCMNTEERQTGYEWVWTNYDLKQEAPRALGYLESYCDDEKSPCNHAKSALQSFTLKGGELV